MIISHANSVIIYSRCLKLAPSFFDWAPKLYLKPLSETDLNEMFKSNNTKLSSSDKFLLKRSFVNWWWLYHEMARCQLLRRRRQWHGPMIIRERFYSNSSKGVISKNDSVFDVVICWFNKKYFFSTSLNSFPLCVSGSFYLYSSLLNKRVVAGKNSGNENE